MDPHRAHPPDLRLREPLWELLPPRHRRHAAHAHTKGHPAAARHRARGAPPGATVPATGLNLGGWVKVWGVGTGGVDDDDCMTIWGVGCIFVPTLKRLHEERRRFD